jgi:lysylphosphatidylglycerol synthetase-like protein (DUF2156 family)
MLSGIAIAGIVAAAAGIRIRVGAFIVFVLVVAIGFGVANLVAGLDFSEAAMRSAGCLVVMEISYIASIFTRGIWRNFRRPSKTASLVDTAHKINE